MIDRIFRGCHKSRKSTITALFLGRFVAEKGIDDLISAIPQALTACPQLRFVLVGYRDDFSTRDPDTLRARLGDFAPCVRFEPWTDQDGIETELANADMLISPSLFESFGMALTEAMMCSVPIVATRTEGASALLGPSGAGILVPPADPARLAEAIVELARDGELRREMGQRGSEYARRELGWPAVAAAMIDVYRECITRPPSP